MILYAYYSYLKKTSTINRINKKQYLNCGAATYHTIHLYDGGMQMSQKIIPNEMFFTPILCIYL